MKISWKELSQLVWVPILFVTCVAFSDSKTSKLAGYNMKKITSYTKLPDTLREVSGLTYVDSNSLACIQDENGILFIYDLQKKSLKSQYRFAPDGDYEGIALVDQSMFILRSDGLLYEIQNFSSKNFILQTYTTGIPASNNEGLCYDKLHNRLLIACKGKVSKGALYKDKRAIYGFDLATKKLTSEPVFEFDVAEIEQFVIEHKLELPLKVKGKGHRKAYKIKLMSSAIAIHPLTNKLFLLSASDHLMFVFSSNGILEHIEPLDAEVFNKSEGLIFLPNGDMFITNEAQGKTPSLLRFDFIP